jgi:SLT domain-containing protein
MPSFSFTAPIISAEQEWNEMNELTKEDREEIQRDIYGTAQQQQVISLVNISSLSLSSSSSSSSSDDSNNNNVSNDRIQDSKFQKALEEIPEKDKKDLMHALEVAPQLVATESDPRRYLHHSGTHEVRKSCRPPKKFGYVNNKRF